jgi:hypothetical protein
MKNGFFSAYTSSTFSFSLSSIPFPEVHKVQYLSCMGNWKLGIYMIIGSFILDT